MGLSNEIREQVLKRRLSTLVVNLTLVVVSVALTLGLIELGCWFWVTKLRPPHLTQWEFRATRPAPYQGADYFGPEFLAEAEASVSGRISTIAELRDFNGRYFNVVDGFRVTTDTPPNPVRRVLMFGGSTMFAQEVPDEYTIASYLQRMLNEQGVRWQVRNFGLPGMNTAQQTLILKRVRLRPEDIVVFYHGVNDIYYLVFGGYDRGWISGTPAFRPVQKLSALNKWLHTWHEYLKDYSYTADVALDIYQRGQPQTVTDPAQLKRSVTHARSQFSEALREAAATARNAHAVFVHFVQPTAFSGNRQTAYEREILKNPLTTAPGVEIAFRKGYPQLLDEAVKLKAEGIDYYDLTDALDGRARGDEVFLDFCHLNHEGNRLIAKKMMEVYFRPLITRVKK
jgi:lysophospholipase L1-like esterase